MKNPTIQRGSKNYDDIERLQLALCEAGHPVDLDARFGPGVEQAVCRFQESRGLVVDGIVAGKTWEALARDSEYGRPLVLEDERHLPGFRGDLVWLHQWEGHAGRAYWPGGQSGVTLDPGLDLGHAPPELIEEAFGDRLSDTEMEAVRSVLGIRGEAARKALDLNLALQDIRVLRTTANQILPLIAGPYWRALCRRFPELSSADTPPEVQTAMLSLAYNRGAHNRALDVLRQPFETSDWAQIGKQMEEMQQDHSLEGIRRRRSAEGQLILGAIGVE